VKNVATIQIFSSRNYHTGGDGSRFGRNPQEEMFTSKIQSVELHAFPEDLFGKVVGKTEFVAANLLHCGRI